LGSVYSVSGREFSWVSKSRVSRTTQFTSGSTLGGKHDSKIRPKEFATGVLAIVAIAFRSLLLVPVYAQVVGATLSGTVTDQCGAVLPNTRISIKNSATAFARALAADPDGFYTAPNLLPGTYEITATASGFATEVQIDSTLTVFKDNFHHEGLYRAIFPFGYIEFTCAEFMSYRFDYSCKMDYGRLWVSRCFRATFRESRLSGPIPAKCDIVCTV
jgi:hypothetical protein